MSREITGADRVVVETMLAAQYHRGPDGEGIYCQGPVILGHRRLSIIDLSDNGRQPLCNEDGTVWVTFNGEIYNFHDLTRDLVQRGHAFRSHSDTEVLVHGYEEWGMAGLLKRLRGMFAFALYDGRLRGGDGGARLFLARDRVGIKPLYYTEKDGCLTFASEAKALLDGRVQGDGRDEAALVGYLCLGSVPSPRSWWKNVKCLPPGHYLAVSPETQRLERYWDETSSEDYSGSLPELLSDTVDRHLIADVPVGVFLSGGMDSAGLAAVASRLRKNELTTLTITFPEEEFSEAREARAFSEIFGTRHHEVMVTKEDFFAEIPRILQAMDQPTADGVNTYFVSRAAKQLGLKVVLSGLGGDEVFFGYGHYRQMLLPDGLMRRYTSAPQLLRTAICVGGSLYGRWRGAERWRRLDYLRRFDNIQGLYLLARGFFAPSQVAELLGTGMKWVQDSLADILPVAGMRNGRRTGDAEQFHQYEMNRYLHDQLLRDSDVFSMAHSIELRVPYLDHVLVEAVGRIPAGAMVSSVMNKPKLAEAVNHPAIAEAGRRPKRGFTFPFSRWILEHTEELEEQAVAADIFDPDAVRYCWREFRAGRLHWSRAWATVAAGRM